jgi:hypothetical protein
VARLALIAASLVLLLGACGLKSDEELGRALLGDIDVSIDTTTSTGAASSTTSTSDGTSTSEESSTSTTSGDDESTTSTTEDGGDGEDLPEPEEPGDLGDDPALDELTDGCFSGDLEACDDLYFESPLGSEYERYGSTCGERNDETFGGCVALYGGGEASQELPPGEEPGDLGDDPELDELTQRCFQGEMQPCDQLYFQSPLGSDYEDYGATCGGRNEPDGGSCVATYGAGG